MRQFILPLLAVFCAPYICLTDFHAFGKSLFSRMEETDSVYSQTSDSENNFLTQKDWTGPWIGMDSTSRGQNAAYLRGTVRLDKPVVSAQAYICAPGWYRLFVNGVETDRNHVLKPAQTDYELRCLYITEDIGAQLSNKRQQKVELGIILGDGWFNQMIAWGYGSMTYGQPRLRAQFVFKHPDGTQTSVPADLTWRAAIGAICENNVYRGEIYDARKEIPQWGINDYSTWQNVVEYPAPGPNTVLEPQHMPSERRIREIKPKSIIQVTEEDGEHPYIYDFGENLTGWCRLQLKNATAGTRIRIEFAEKLNTDGTLFRTNIGNEINGTVQVDYYTAKGAPKESWEPSFTFHGFQYAALYIEAGSLKKAPSSNTLTAIVVHTDLQETASFDCSDPQLVRLHEAAGRTMLAGMHGLPMDCPVRERCGWLGDAHVISRTLLTRYDAASFLLKYARDIETGGRNPSNEPRAGKNYNYVIREPKPAGVPHMIAPGKRLCNTASPDWGCAQVFIPWEICTQTNDTGILKEFLEPMRRWTEYLGSIADPHTGLLFTGLGDWCSPEMRRAGEAGRPWIGSLEVPITSSGIYIRCCHIMAQVEKIVGEPTRRHHYETLADSLSRNFTEHFFLPDFEQTEYSQTALVYAYLFCDNELLPREKIVSKLVELCDEGHNFDTGIFGTAPLLHILTAEGRGDIAQRLLTKCEYPSYRAMLDIGATTLWEHWPIQGYNGGYEVYDGSMSHPMHAAFDEWFYTGIAGLATRDSILEPWTFNWNNFPGLDYASASRKIPEGRISSKWRRMGKEIRWEIEVPEGTEARLIIPTTDTSGRQIISISSGKHEFRFSVPEHETFSEHQSAQEHKIDSLLKLMTIEEKVSICSGAAPHMAFRGIPRLDIPEVQCCDGPRGPNIGGAATAFPSGIAWGASWNPELVEKAGKVMGNETRVINRRVLLGPANNILRDPLCGRFFEYYTEDPHLNSRITVASVKGIQSEKVAACLKHYACNNRENNRNFYMSMISDRPLHEIYLPAYEAAVKEGGLWGIMTAANGVNGEFASDSHFLLTDILKDKWGFDGFVITDWLQTRSTEKAAFAGLDISMPGGEDCGFGHALLDAVNKGKVPISVIDDKVRRILRIYERIGALDNKDYSTKAEINTPEHQETALRLAEESIVLLRNEDNMLPLRKGMKILVTGPNADKRFCLPGMGGSSGIESPYEITVLDGLGNLSGNNTITYFPTEQLGGFSLIPIEAVHSDRNGLEQGWRTTYSGGDRTLVRTEPQLDFMWEMKAPDKSIPTEAFSANFQGWITPPVSGVYSLRLTVGGWCAIFPEGCYGAPTIVADDSRESERTVTATIQLQKGVPYFFCINYSKNRECDASLRLEWKLPETTEAAEALSRLDTAAEEADAVIFVGGLDHSLDTEGRDRLTMEFPQDQERLIKRLSSVNPRIVVVLINGSPMEIGNWIDTVPAVLEAWYPGMEGGTAIAKALYGDCNPSGRLPFTWPKKLEDSPSHKLATQDLERVNYDEDLMVGYRYYDTMDIEPQFPFGYGLSYTTFRYGKLRISEKDGKIRGSIKVSNTGKYDGSETIQFYVRPENSPVKRPIHELKAFEKVFLKAGESRTVTFTFPARAFSYYSEAEDSWVEALGDYTIEAAASSRDIRSTALIKIK